MALPGAVKLLVVAVSVLVVGVSTLLLGLAVVALLRRWWWGCPLTLVVVMPHAAFTALALPTVGWRTRSSPSPRDHAPYYDPAVTPLVVRVADVAMIPWGSPERSVPSSCRRSR